MARKTKYLNPRLLAACSVLFLLCAVPATARNMADLPPNNWVEVKPRWKFPTEASGGAFQERGWGTFRFRSAANSVVFYEGYGPSDRGQYCIYANSLYEYNPPADSVTMLALSNYYCNVGTLPQPLPQNQVNPTPMDRHTYSQLAYSPADDQLYLSHGASGSGNHPHDLWAYSFKDRKWQNMGASPGAVQAWELVGEGNLILNSKTNELYLFRNRKAIYVYNVASKTWKTLAPKGTTAGVVGAHGAYDSKRDRFVFYGNIWTENDVGSTMFTFFDVASNTWTDQTPAGTWPPALSYSSVEYNSKWDLYMMHGGYLQKDTWIYNPGTKAWFNLKTPNSTQPNGKQMNLVYDPVHDVLINSVKGVMYLLRYVPSDAGIIRKVPGGQGMNLKVNPRKGGVDFGISDPTGKASSLRLRIRDFHGSLVEDLGYLGQAERVRWDTSQRSKGVYFMEMTGLDRSMSVPFSLVE